MIVVIFLQAQREIQQGFFEKELSIGFGEDISSPFVMFLSSA